MLKSSITSKDVITATEFKTHALRLLTEAQQRGKKFLITRNGKPVAQLIPARPTGHETSKGSLAAYGKIVGDIVHINFTQDWNVFKEK